MTKRYIRLNDDNQAVGKAHTTPECRHLTRTDVIAEVDAEDLDGFDVCKTCDNE